MTTFTVWITPAVLVLVSPLLGSSLWLTGTHLHLHCDHHDVMTVRIRHLTTTRENAEERIASHVAISSCQLIVSFHCLPWDRIVEKDVAVGPS